MAGSRGLGSSSPLPIYTSANERAGTVRVCLAQEHNTFYISVIPSDQYYQTIESFIFSLLLFSISDTGRLGGALIGIVTSRDIDFLNDDEFGLTLDKVMTPRDQLIVAQSGCTLREANQMLQKSKKVFCECCNLRSSCVTDESSLTDIPLRLHPLWTLL